MNRPIRRSGRDQPNTHSKVEHLPRVASKEKSGVAALGCA
jgi:hypothetical protein